MARLQRKRLFVDRVVQGAILLRVLGYWVSCLLFILVPLLIGRTIVEPERLFFEQFGAIWGQFGPVLTCTMLILPLVIYDLVKLTNRFAGPIFRLRREMFRLARGDSVRPIRFRDGDFWQEFATSFNQIAERLGQAERPPERAPSDESDKDELCEYEPDDEESAVASAV